MVIRIRCRQCRKQISIDEAFAGGVCRCPFCKAIVQVPAGKERPNVERPIAPPTVRPASPAQAATPANQPAPIPTARPARRKWLIWAVLALLLVLTVIVAYIVATTRKTVAQGEPDAPAQQEQSDSSGPSIAGIRLVSPVIYCLDGGGSMRDLLGYAELLVRHSVQSLGAGDRFEVTVWTEAGPRNMSQTWLSAQPGTQGHVAKFLQDIVPAGRTEAGAGIKAALEMSPKTIVVLASKELTGLDVAAEAAKAKGVTVHTVSIGGLPDAEKIMAETARSTGGPTRAFSAGMLDMWLRETAPVPEE